ncbi:MAG: hypothetical protein P8Z49_02985 [Acidobacteriota bacterium]|jgi:hypothetical protein
MTKKRLFRLPVAFAAGAVVLSLSAMTLYRLDSVIPDPGRKQEQIMSVDGSTYHYRANKVDIQVTPILLKGIGRYYRTLGLRNPFEDFPPEMNYIFIRLRLENLDKHETLEFIPSNTMMGSMMPKDETQLYEMMYKLSDGNKRLVEVGKTFYFKELNLPPGYWFERLMLFEYKENRPARHMDLVLGNLSTGRNRFDVTFPFKLKFTKEKR